MEASSEAWRLESNDLVTRTMADGTMTVFPTGLHLDRIMMEDDAPRFNERLVICDHSIINLIALPL